jgi:hypothetical protein
MNDAVGMGVVEGISDLHRVCKRGVDWRQPLMDDRAERSAVDVLHDDERTVGAVAHLVDRADVRVAENRRVLCLADQPTPRCRIGRGADERLDRDIAPEQRVAGAVDFAHSASGDEVADLVAAQAGPGLQPRSCERHSRRGILAHEMGSWSLPQALCRRLALE